MPDAGEHAAPEVPGEGVVTVPTQGRPPVGGRFGPWRDRLADSPRYRGWVLVASLLGLLSAGFSITVLAVSVPEIAGDLDAPVSLMIWVVTGAIFAYAIFGPSAGKLADMLGARRVWLVSLSAVTVFAALSAVAQTGATLVALRVLGAAVGAAAGPSSLAMINRLYARHERARALGYWSMVAAGGPVIGVVIGGPVVEAFSWRWIFVGQVPLTLLAVAVGWLVLPVVPRRVGVRFDVAGTVLLAAGSVSLLVALNRGPQLGWTSPAVLAGFALCPVLLAGFVAVERRVASPLLPVRYLRDRNFAASVTNQFSLNFAYMGAFTITPLMLSGLLGWQASKIGYVSIARPLVFAIAGPIAGYLAVRVGERTNAVVGGVAIAISMLGLALVSTSSSDVLIVVALGLSGLGMGTAAPAMAASLANAVDEEDLGVATAFQQMCMQIGVVVGAQIMLSVQQASSPIDGDVPTDPSTLSPAVLDALATSYHWAYLTGAAVAGLGIVAALFVRSTRRDPVHDADRLLDELEVLDAEMAPASARP